MSDTKRKILCRFKLKALISEREFSENKQITIREISEKTGISKTTLSLIANSNGSYKTNTEILAKLCQYFQCSIEDLLEFVEDKNS